MYVALEIAGGLLGLFVTGVAIFTAWLMYGKAASLQKDAVYTARSEHRTADLLLRWTLMDYAILLLFIVGMVFLFVDVLAMLRDRVSYPYYHYGYLLSGFVFSLLGMLFMLVRLAVILKLAQSNRPSLLPDDHHEPHHTD